MAEQIGFTQENYKTLCEAMATGARQVMYGDKMIIYRDLKEMERIKAQMESALGIKRASRTRYLQHSKGLQ